MLSISQNYHMSLQDHFFTFTAASTFPPSLQSQVTMCQYPSLLLSNDNEDDDVDDNDVDVDDNHTIEGV